MIIQALIDTLIQVIIFALIPFIYWFITVRKNEPFLSWLGFKKMTIKDNNQALLLTLLACSLLALPAFIILNLIDTNQVANAHITTLNLEGIILILIYAIVQTGFSEELFFRGFLLKLFSPRLGFNVGNIIQALLFGLLHGLVFYSKLDFFYVFLIVGFSATAGWILGYLNEKIASGSILPSWLIHSFMNILSSLLLVLDIV